MKNQEQVLKELFEFAESLGMFVFFNSDSEEEHMNGFIIGTEDYFYNIADGLEDLENYNKVMGVETISKPDMH
jgi:hypothetical protein